MSKARILGLAIALYSSISILQPTSALAKEQCADLTGQDRKAAEYLNQVRSNPVPYAQHNDFSSAHLAPTPALSWNSQLAGVARQKAESMARHNYFSHVDPNGLGPNQRIVQAGYRLPKSYPLDPEANTTESLASGASNSIEAVDQLLIDQGLPDAEHRVHLLATAPVYRTHTEVGVGIACNPNSTYLYYYVILTAPPAVLPRLAHTAESPLLRSRFTPKAMYMVW
jgi:uncharacterized protein YkwD